MLEIDIGSKKGILFVRFYGYLNKKTREKLNSEVIKLINTVGIKNIVLNIQNLKQIDKFGIEYIKKCYKTCDKSYICLNANQLDLIKKLKWVINEEEAIKLINT